jgi:hypothetical protein
MPVTYCDKAYKEVMTWTEKTKIKYAPNRKSGKSFVRYGKYMKGKTVGESLAKGSFGLDLLFDYEKGLLRATGGPKRAQPPQVDGMSKEDRAKLSKTDLMLGKMYAKWKMWKASFKHLAEHGMTRQELKDMNDVKDPEGGKDSIIVAIGRREAQAKAKEILAAVKKEGRPVAEDEVLACLQLWGFKENVNRGNVMPDGHKFVHSDTIGMIKMSTCERTLLTVGTNRYPEFTELIARWFKEQLPAELKDKFAYTSVNINKNYAGKLHRDGNNCGPSFIKAFGKFSGGELNYWPSDDKNTPLEDFDPKAKVTMNIKDNLMLFDGNRGHFVNSFKGERFSLVFFSIRTWNKVPKKDAKDAARCGIPLPTKKSMASMQGLLGPSGKAGYRTYPVTAGNKGAKRKASTALEATAPKRRSVATPCRGRA